VTPRFALELRRRVRLPAGLESLSYGFLYWLVFLLVLEPDNLLRAMRAGYRLAFGIEAARILAAALLGAMATPVLVALRRRFPLLGADRLCHLAIHLAGNAILGFMLIVASCFLAAWGFERQLWPTGLEVRYQLAANWTLLVFALCALTAIMHLLRFTRDRDPATSIGTQANRSATQGDHVARVSIRAGGRLRFLEHDEIDWVEAQGNYVALHTRSRVQLLRRTLKDFAAELNDARFVRIHRSTIVALSRIREMCSLPNGDAMLRLEDGSELRVSRRYREELLQRWGGRG